VFLDLVAKALGDDLLGFHLAQNFDLRMIGLLYYVLASSETLGNWILCAKTRLMAPQQINGNLRQMPANFR
jgi:hypothetical protein